MSHHNFWEPVHDEAIKIEFETKLAEIGGPRTVPSFCRRDFESFNSSDWVYERSDGDRCFGLLMPTGLYVLLNGEYFVVPSMALSTIDNKQYQSGTLFEAELCYHYEQNTYHLLVTDVLFFQNKPLYKSRLESRLGHIWSAVVGPYRQKFGDNHDGLFLLGKLFMKIEKVEKLLSDIRHFDVEDEPTGHRYVYHNGKRYNENTGLVFVSDNEGYTNQLVREWTWPVLNSVNFSATLIDDECELQYLVNGELSNFKTIKLPVDKLDKLKNDLEYTACGVICCGYDISQGDWTYYSVSPLEVDGFEKIISLLEICAQNIQHTELVKYYKHIDEVVYQTPSDVSPEIAIKRTHSESFEYSPEERPTSRRKTEDLY